MYVAHRELVAEEPDGRRFPVTLRIGVPTQQDRDWVCSVVVEGLASAAVETHGADSLQALLLAVQNLRGMLSRFVRSGGKFYLPGDEASGPMPVSEILSEGA